MNQPRWQLEQGRSITITSWPLAAEFAERQSPGIPAGGEVDEQVRRHQYVVGSPMRGEAAGQAVSQGECVHQRTELVAVPPWEQPPRELERVEDLGTLPVAQTAAQDTCIDVRVVSH
jgi:hypothetical protein